MNDEEINALFEGAMDALEAKQEALGQQYGIGEQEEWKADLAAGTIRFLRGGREVASAELLVVGSLSRKDVWMWAWANDALPAPVRAASEPMKDFARRTGLDVFTERAWEAGDAEAWEMTALACSHFGADGAYRMPAAQADVFALLMNVRALEADS